VRPTTVSDWRTVILKEAGSTLAYGLYAHDGSRPAGYIRVSGADRDALGTAALAANTWTHLAVTYDGATLRLFVNGVQAGTRAIAGAVAASSNPLRIGGNTVWGEYFSGLIDEVRVYSRVLTAAEITTDMNTAVRP
jgi:hydrogenase maturation factor HypE